MLRGGQKRKIKREREFFIKNQNFFFFFSWFTEIRLVFFCLFFKFYCSIVYLQYWNIRISENASRMTRLKRRVEASGKESTVKI